MVPLVCETCDPWPLVALCKTTALQLSPCALESTL